MKHLSGRRKFSRKTSHRVAMFQNLCLSLFKHGKIKTTLEKAKTIRPIAEKILTTGKKLNKEQDVASVRKILSIFRNNTESVEIVKNAAKAVENRNGGYTRIIKGLHRYGDSANVAIIEIIN